MVPTCCAAERSVRSVRVRLDIAIPTTCYRSGIHSQKILASAILATLIVRNGLPEMHSERKARSKDGRNGFDRQKNSPTATGTNRVMCAWIKGDSFQAA